MDKLGKLVLNTEGIAKVHEMYKNAINDSLYFPGMKSLIMSSMVHCDYCSCANMRGNTLSIQERLNYGVQICNCCLSEHKQHLTFFERTMRRKTLSWWQFISLNHDNNYIQDFSPMKPIGIGLCSDEKLPCFDHLLIDITRHIKLVMSDTSSQHSEIVDIKLPIIFRVENELCEIAKTRDIKVETHSRYITLDSFCSFDSSLKRDEILQTIRYYINI
tara:strand:- start:102 stop:752 length:651 start_codon:yes stop_codon:yes gene_type:complete